MGNRNKSSMDYTSLGCCALAFALYLNTLNAGFVYDDRRAILGNTDVSGKTPWHHAFHNDYWGTPLTDSGSHGSYRPLCVLSFKFNYILGGYTAWGYHLVNNLMHCLATGLVVKLARHFLTSKLGIWVTGTLFAVHPIHTETVAGIVGRADLAACIFYLLTYLIYLKHIIWRERNDHRQWLALFLTIVFAVCALLFKETAISAIVVCGLFDVLRGFCGFHDKNRLRSLSILSIALISMLYIRLSVISVGTSQFSTADNPIAKTNSIWTRFLTFLYLPIFNFKLLIYPSVLSFDWGMDAIPRITTIWDFRNLLSISFYTILLVTLWTNLKNLMYGSKGSKKSSSLLSFNSCSSNSSKKNHKISKYTYCRIMSAKEQQLQQQQQQLQQQQQNQHHHHQHHLPRKSRTKRKSSTSLINHQNATTTTATATVKNNQETFTSSCHRLLSTSLGFVNGNKVNSDPINSTIDNSIIIEKIAAAAVAAVTVANTTNDTICHACKHELNLQQHTNYCQNNNNNNNNNNNLMNSYDMQCDCYDAAPPTTTTTTNGTLAETASMMLLQQRNTTRKIHESIKTNQRNNDQNNNIHHHHHHNNNNNNRNIKNINNNNQCKLTPRSSRSSSSCSNSTTASQSSCISTASSSCLSTTSESSTSVSSVSSSSSSSIFDSSLTTTTTADAIDFFSITPCYNLLNKTTTTNINNIVIIMSIAFLTLPFLPATNLFFYVGFVVAERLLYLPSVGYCLLIGFGISKFFEQSSKQQQQHQQQHQQQQQHQHSQQQQPSQYNRKKFLIILCMCIILITLSAKTFKRNLDWRDEESLYRSSIIVNPPKALGNLGSVLSTQGRYAEAKEVLLKALKYRPNMADVHFNLGILNQNQQNFKSAVDHFQRAIQFRPNLAIAYLNLGTSLIALGRCREAATILKDGTKVNGHGVRDRMQHENARMSSYLQLGSLYAEQGKLQRALAVYREALHSSVTGSYQKEVLYQRIGDIFGRLQQWDEAEKYHRATLDIQPNNVAAHLSYGLTLAKNSSRASEAELWLKRAVELAPTQSSVYHHYAEFLTTLARYKEAIPFRLRASELSPNDYSLAVAAATTFRLLDRKVDAEKWYRKAVHLRPDDARAHTNLGAILHLLGRTNKAAASYKEALRLQPGDPTTLGNLAKLGIVDV